MDIVTEAEINVEAGIGELFVIVGGKADHFIVAPRKDELAVLDCCQTKENHVAGSDPEMFHDNLRGFFVFIVTVKMALNYYDIITWRSCEIFVLLGSQSTCRRRPSKCKIITAFL